MQTKNHWHDAVIEKFDALQDMISAYLGAACRRMHIYLSSSGKTTPAERAKAPEHVKKLIAYVKRNKLDKCISRDTIERWVARKWGLSAKDGFHIQLTPAEKRLYDRLSALPKLAPIQRAALARLDRKEQD